MPDATKQTIEKRILQGYKKPDWEEKNEYIKRRDGRSLQRLDWLKNNGCFLSAATEKEMARLKKANPEYTSEYAKSADRSLEGRGGWGRTDTEHSALLELPLEDILPKAEEAMDRHDKFLVEYDPFAGLCETRPTRAFAALRYEAKHGNNRPWAWCKFLYREGCKDDSERMKRFIAEILARLPDEVAVQIIHALANWVSKVSKKMTPPCIPVFERLTKRLIKILQKNHKTQTTKSYHYTSMQLIDTPAWYFAEALFNDPRIKLLNANQFPPLDWKALAEEMLNLPDD
ncbi:MAG: hypothetical protein K8953_04350, partial [Proteobacteria bacterium]|nr:hypothetical protein [Pseudomonadota bacterium]